MILESVMYFIKNNVELLTLLISLLAFIITLYFNIRSERENTKTRQLQLLDSIFNKIQNMETEYYKTYKNKNKKEKEEWDSLFFNNLEYLAFLVNNKYINWHLFLFFKDAFILWYDQILTKIHPEWIKNPKKYEEIKKLYNRLKARRPELFGLLRKPRHFVGN